MLFRLISLMIVAFLIIGGIGYGVLSTMDFNLLAMLSGEQTEEKKEDEDSTSNEEEKVDKDKKEENGDTLVFKNRALTEDSSNNPPLTTPTPSIPPSGDNFGIGESSSSSPLFPSSGMSGNTVDFVQVNEYPLPPEVENAPKHIYKFNEKSSLPEMDKYVDFSKECAVLIILNQPHLKSKKIEVEEIKKLSSNHFEFIVKFLPKPNLDNKPAHMLLKLPKEVYNDLLKFRIVDKSTL